MTRPDWDQTWMAVAEQVAPRSDCSVRQVGCVVASADNRDHWVGYNGPPAGFATPMGKPDGSGCGIYCPQGREAPDRDSGLRGCHQRIAGEAACVSVHAEVNALMQSDRRLRAGGTAYVTAAPCWKCALAVANSGVRRLVCPRWEPDRRNLAINVYRLYGNANLLIVHPSEEF